MRNRFYLFTDKIVFFLLELKQLNKVFNHSKLKSLKNSLNFIRVKAVINCI